MKKYKSATLHSALKTCAHVALFKLIKCTALPEMQALRNKGGRGGVCLPMFFDNVPFFFEEPFKCAFIENIKSKIVNIQ